MLQEQPKSQTKTTQHSTESALTCKNNRAPEIYAHSFPYTMKEHQGLVPGRETCWPAQRFGILYLHHCLATYHGNVDGQCPDTTIPSEQKDQVPDGFPEIPSSQYIHMKG